MTCGFGWSESAACTTKNMSPNNTQQSCAIGCLQHQPACNTKQCLLCAHATSRYLRTGSVCRHKGHVINLSKQLTKIRGYTQSCTQASGKPTQAHPVQQQAVAFEPQDQAAAEKPGWEQGRPVWLLSKVAYIWRLHASITVISAYLTALQ